MPLTSAEKSKRYRDRLKETNPEKFKSLQKKNLERTKQLYKTKTSVMTEEQKEERKKKWREYNKQRDGPKVTNTEQDVNDQDVKVWNKSVARNIQKRVERNLQKENIELRNSVITLKKGYNRLLRQIKEQQQQITKMNEKFEVIIKKLEKVPTNELETLTSDCPLEEITPLKKSDQFVNTNLLGVVTPKKVTVKKVILEHNVLTEALKKEYTSASNDNKNKLKNMVNSDLVRKYRVKTNLSKILGLKSGIKRYRNKPKINILWKKISAFYEQDDVSRASAGKKECKTLKQCKKQKRYLLDTLNNLHKKYVSENGPVGLTTFKRYRPFYIVPPRLKDLETCACSKHSNMQYMANTLKLCGIINTKDLNEIISKNVCDIKFKECMYGMCDLCLDNGIDENAGNDEQTKWMTYIIKDHQYIDNKGNMKKTKQMVKEEKRGTINELIQIFNFGMRKFKTHVFNVVHQYQQYKTCIQNLDSNEIAVHIDFSENWTCKYAEEVQAMHFGASKNQITLHTGVLYFNDMGKRVSFCSISPDNSHNPEAIWAHLDPIMKHIKIHYPSVDTIHFFSDGPTSQYRQKKNFFLLSNNIFEYEFKHATWSFFEASHGKGAADGIGGAVKRTLDLKVAHGIDIPDAMKAYDILKKTETAIQIFYVGTENIKLLDSNIVTKLTPLRETMKIHQVVLMHKHLLNYRVLSCFCQQLKGKCDCFMPKLHKFEVTELESEETNYESVLDETTGAIRKVKKQIEKIEESERVADLNNEDMFDLIDLDDLDIMEDNLLNDSLVKFVESRLENLNNDKENGTRNKKENCLKRKHIGNKSTVLEVQKPKKNRHKESSEEDSDDFSVHDSSTDFDYLEENNVEMELLVPDVGVQTEKCNIEITKNSHVLVNFKLKKRNKFFLGQVLQVFGKSTYEVKYLRHKGNGKFAWPVLDDVSVVDKSEIVQVLSNPLSDRRGIKTFDLSTFKYKIE